MACGISPVSTSVLIFSSSVLPMCGSSIASADSHVRVLHRPEKRGLGPAYIAAFRHALDAGAEFIVEMDADFSHDPSHLPGMLEAALDEDLVLGSRYVEGGGVRNWGRLR